MCIKMRFIQIDQVDSNDTNRLDTALTLLKSRYIGGGTYTKRLEKGHPFLFNTSHGDGSCPIKQISEAFASGHPARVDEITQDRRPHATSRHRDMMAHAHAGPATRSRQCAFASSSGSSPGQ